MILRKRQDSILTVERDGTVRCENCDARYEDTSGASVAELRQAIRDGDFDAHPCVKTD